MPSVKLAPVSVAVITNRGKAGKNKKNPYSISFLPDKGDSKSYVVFLGIKNIENIQDGNHNLAKHLLLRIKALGLMLYHLQVVINKAYYTKPIPKR